MVRVSDLLARIDVDQHGHWSLLSFLGPQWGFFPASVNSRILPRFNALMTPIRSFLIDCECSSIWIQPENPVRPNRLPIWRVCNEVLWLAIRRWFRDRCGIIDQLTL